MEFLFKIPAKEFNQDLFLSLQEMIKRFKSGELTISLREKPETIDAQESLESYENRLKNSIAELDSGKGIVFSKESLQAYIEDLIKE